MLNEHVESIRLIGILMFYIYFSYTDIKTREISNKAVLLCLVTGVVLAFAGLAMSDLINCFGGGFAACLVFLAIHLITKDQMGMGDVKIMACLGLYAGLQNVFSIVIVALLGTVAVGLMMIFLKRGTRKSELPFAPFVLASLVVHVGLLIL